MPLTHTSVRRSIKTVANKLSHNGISGPLLSWLKSYKSNRQQQVKLNGFLSEVFNVTSDVPQGSHLGPLLFSLIINDLIDSLSSSTLLFADDMKLVQLVS